ncbi:MAG: inositol monophosphatase, partial [Gammaproteobacteria bacterium]|nr:inositol monophosphatase [Gammaproteobacteria bacterium]
MVNIALRAARRAGRIVLRAMDRAGSLRVEEKAKNDFVSEIDRAAEDAIVDTIM